MVGIDEFEGAFLIADLTGYTALTEVHGNSVALRIISRYNEIVQSVLTQDINFYQQVGDEIFLVSTSARSLLHYTIRLMGRIEKESHFPSIHAGLHFGNVVKQNETLFGSAINLTSRIASAAHAGQILCSSVFKELVEESEISFIPLGEKRFKNVMKPLEIFEIVKTIELKGTVYQDPVCRMNISESTAPVKLSFEKKTLYFCSLDCAKKFILHPEFFMKSDHG